MTRRALILTLAIAGLSACSAAPSSTEVNTAASPDYATAPLNLSSPENTAYSLMIAMYRGDAGMVEDVFLPSGTLRRARADGTVTEDALPGWRERVATFKVGQAHEELFEIKVDRFGKLANVWAPFVIRVNGELVGCGVNHFAMIEASGDWRIVSGMDVQAPREACAGFRESYGGGE